ncbi:MAG: LysM peptidoglycan-binding domain-containing protein [Chloroflexi bacterium]|nr:LysM peptidoglycan-binding domain-containing protein [Chloroflexota bacterium]
MNKSTRPALLISLAAAVPLAALIAWAAYRAALPDVPATLTVAQALTQMAGTPRAPAPPTDTAAPNATALPTVTATPTATPFGAYIVQSGDTLIGIAARFGISVQALQAANGLTGELILQGQQLILPGVAPTDTPLPPTETPVPTATVPHTASPVASLVAALPTATSAPANANGWGAPVPGPSPTWSVYAFPPRAPASGPTKLGFHVTLNSGGVLDYVSAVHPPVMKGVDDIGYLKDVEALSPNTITIGRYTVLQENIGSGDPTQRGIDFVNEMLPKYQAAPWVDYWEGWNEVTYPNYEWYASFEAARACEMQKHGLKAAIGGFSTGTPEPWQFAAFVPAVEAGIRCGAIMTTHEYGAPTMYLWWSQGLPESYGNPAVPAYPDRGPLMGRYRFLYRDILIPRGLLIPLVISEAGIDGGAGAGQRPGYSNAQGWLGFTDYWSAELGQTDAIAFYVDQLAWYDSLLRQDSYVIGATIFNISGGSSWQSFEASSVIPKLTEYALSLK